MSVTDPEQFTSDVDSDSEAVQEVQSGTQSMVADEESIITQYIYICIHEYNDST